MKRLFIIILILAFLVTDNLLAQKGMKIVGNASQDMPNVIYRTGWAVVIGINKYPNVPQLEYAVADADAVADLIKRKFGFEESNVTVLKDAQATRQGIMNALNYLTNPNRVKKDDCVFIYFSGHGQTVPLPESGGGGNMGYLVPYDAQIDLSELNMSQYDQYCIGMDELNKKGSQIPAKHVIFIVDACYSGLVIESQRGLDPKTADFVRKVASVPVRQIITAGGKEDQSSENPSLGHGLFTYKLLQGLESGIADDNSDGIITGSELGNHLRGVVPRENANQIPQFRMKGEGEFMFLPQEVKAETPSIPTPPSGSKFSIKDLQNETERSAAIEKAKKEWASKLDEMKTAYNEVKDFEKGSGTENLKITAWQRFLDAYKADNPYTQEDDTMRQEAIKHLEYGKNQSSETKPTVTSTSAITGQDGAEMLLIPAGEFLMGSNDYDDEKPVHTVYLDAFYIDKYEVTNAQYKKFMDATPRHKAPYYWRDPNYNAPNQPVVGVTWNDAKAYADWAKEQLPTEAEWEKAARGGLVGKKYVWGYEWPPPSKAGNLDNVITNDDYAYPAPVGSFKPNGYGLYDMVGNVWEWCADWYDSSFYANLLKSNPIGPRLGSSHVIRGGSWQDGNSDILRVSKRFSKQFRISSPSGSNYSAAIGFRCVRAVSVRF